MQNTKKAIDWLQVSKKVMPYVLVMAIVVIGCALSTSGYSCDVWDKAKTTAKDIYEQVRELATYVAAAAFVISLLIALCMRDQRKVDMALDVAKKVVVIYLLILGAGWIFQWGRDLMTGAPDIFGTGIST